jgi:hypothetical protein
MSCHPEAQQRRKGPEPGCLSFGCVAAPFARFARSRVTAFLLLVIAACSPAPRTPAPLRLETVPAGADTRLTLIAAPGVKLNARLKPALELPGGGVVRFDSDRLTPDSAYFAEPPSALLSGRHTKVRGTLRASVCDEGELVCRSITLEL